MFMQRVAAQSQPKAIACSLFIRLLPLAMVLHADKSKELLRALIRDLRFSSQKEGRVRFASW